MPLLLTSICLAQQPLPGTPAGPAAPPAASANTNAAAPTASASTLPPRQQEPYILEDGGLSFEPMYWLNYAQPKLRGGAADSTYGSIAYPGDANPGIGGEVGLPAGRSDTLRISYFRIQGNSNTTVTSAASIFGENYNPGDYIAANYTLQSAKISWDVLGYTWHKRSGNIRLKELYEMQYVDISSGFNAPLKPVTVDASGNTDYNQANGSKMLFYPSFGLGLEEALGHHLRWEIKASGFGIPHHATLWDGQADLALTIRNAELIVGGKAFHFKTSPQGDEYFTDTLSGAFVGLRYYFGERAR